MESRTIQLTASAIREKRLDIRACGRDFFPHDAIGSSSKKGTRGVDITLLAKGLSEPIKTDIPSDNRSRRQRWFFRERGHIKEFIRSHSFIPGDKVEIRQVRNRTYELIPHKRQLTFIDLFAGIGGTRLAFEAAGCKCVFSSEWDKFAQQTYEANFGEKPHGDIRKIPSSEIPDHDILVAGFPCHSQGFAVLLSYLVLN
jgi:hypothetical protein